MDCSISIIIPVFNEAGLLGRLLNDLDGHHPLEIIVVDGQSDDGTQNVVRSLATSIRGLRILSTARSRPVQMNAGAAVADGDWLLFLHADTHLSQVSFERLSEALRTAPEFAGGAFYLRLAARGWYYTYLEWYSRWRSRLFSLPYGDQALFVRRSVFHELGGFREDHPIMEDVEFVRRLKKGRPFRMIDAHVTTSARRFEKGPLRRGLRNLGIQILYALGVHPQRLVKLY